MATRKPIGIQPPLLLRTYSLLATNEQSLHQLSQAASDLTGWTISKSALLRALIAFADAQGAGWLAHELVPRIEAEIEGGRVWGSQTKPQR
jgi:glycine/D-amino acid oxidase-like deaminating enzyme